MSEIAIRPLTADALDELSELLVETVANGGSVTFLYPVAPADGRAFWDGALASAAKGERIVLGAFDGAALIGTVSVLLNSPENQRHRAEIAKMMTRVSHRRRGVAAALLREAERLALAEGRALLTLDTASVEGASELYERAGYTFAGEIPDYALTPRGVMSGTRLYWKRIADAACPATSGGGR
jgi:ribosomal protein S18 acetylase RimI-like enzyme